MNPEECLRRIDLAKGSEMCSCVGKDGQTPFSETARSQLLLVFILLLTTHDEREERKGTVISKK